MKSIQANPAGACLQNKKDNDKSYRFINLGISRKFNAI